MQSNYKRVTPETLYLMSKKGSLEKIKELEQLNCSKIQRYEHFKDYYRKLREALIRKIKSNSIINLMDEVDRINVKDNAQYHSFSYLSNNLLLLFSEIQFNPSKKVFCRKVMDEKFVIQSPTHVTIEVENEKWIIYFYFLKTKLSQEMVQFQLQLMRTLSDGEGIPTIIDAQRGKIYQAKENEILSFVINQELDFIQNYLRIQKIAA